MCAASSVTSGNRTGEEFGWTGSFFEKTWLSLFEHCNGRAFDVEDWLFEVRQVGRFDLICFKERPASSDRPCLGRIGDMMLHARDRIRVPFHSFTIPRGKQDPGSRDHWQRGWARDT